MPNSTTGATLTGAATGAGAGAAVGTAIMPVVGTAIGAVAGGLIGAGGAYLSARGTADAQTTQNKATAQQAAAESAQSFYNYLASQGTNLQQLVSQFPEFQQEYERIRALGEKRDFQTWLVTAIKDDYSHPIWDAIARPAGTAGAANRKLAAWAVDANGNPLEPALLKQLLNIQQGLPANGAPLNPATAPVGNIATVENIHALFAARPEILNEITSQDGWENAGISPEQWLVNHITQTEGASGGGRFTDSLRTFLTTPVSEGGGAAPNVPAAPGTPEAPAGPAGTGNNQTIDPGITAIIPQATDALSGVFDGRYLKEVQAGLKPAEDARLAEAAAMARRLEEQRAGSGLIRDTELTGIGAVTAARTAGATGIYDASTAAAQGIHAANVDKLAQLLGVRKEAAEQIYNASVTSAGGVRDARTTGANNIYGAESLKADTYAQASEQALSRVLAQQTAERARRGFTGGSSGSDMLTARLNAEYLQKGAGARADAGVNLQTRLSDAEVGYATDFGRAGIGKATTVGQSNEADAQAKLAAAVELARSLGIAGTTKATTLASTGEQNAIAEMQARVADATRRLGYLTSDADIAKARADLQNAQDQLTALTSDQARKIGSISTPFNLAGLDLGLKGGLNNQKYSDIDALFSRMGLFTGPGASGPQLTNSVPVSVLNGSQIAGGAVSAFGSAVGAYANSKEFQDLVRTWSAGGGGGGGESTVNNAVNGTTANPAGSLLGSSSFLGNATLFPKS